MATKRVRIQQAKDRANIEELKLLASSFSPYFEEVLDLAEKGDIEGFRSLVESKFSGQDKETLLSKFKYVTSKLPTRTEALRSIIDQVKDEGALSTEQLEERKFAFEELEKLPKRSATEIRDDLASKIDSIFGERNQYSSDPNRKSIASQVADDILRGENPTTALNKIKGNDNKDFQFIVDKLNSELPNYIKNINIETPILSEDIKRVQDILNARKTESEKEAELNKFLTEVPAESRQEMEEYIAGQERSGRTYLQERVLPSVQRRLQARGLLETPEEVASLLGAESAEIQKGIEKSIIDIESANSQFFANAAFRLTQARIEKEQNKFRQQLAFERAQIKEQQRHQFTTTEKQKQFNFEQDLLKKELDSNISSKLAGADSGIDTSSLYAQAGQNLGSIVSSYALYGRDSNNRQQQNLTGQNTTSVPKEAYIKTQ